MAAGGPSLAQNIDPQGSLAAKHQDVFNPRLKDSDFFETRTNMAMSTSGQYAAALKYADCVAAADQAAVAAALARDAGSPEETSAYRALGAKHKTCAQRGVAAQAMILRSALAEVLWKKAGANPNPANRQEIGVEDVQSFIKHRPLGERAVKVSGLPLYSVARCQVMALPDQAAKVLRSVPGSGNERAEVATLYKYSSLCGVTNGLGNFSPTAVRASLADAFYQQVMSTKL